MSNQSNQSNQSPSNDSKLERGRKISLAQTGVTKKPVTVKVGDIEYKTLCDALRAHNFNVQGDWIKARKLIKQDGKADMIMGDKTITFISI